MILSGKMNQSKLLKLIGPFRVYKNSLIFCLGIWEKYGIIEGRLNKGEQYG